MRNNQSFTPQRQKYIQPVPPVRKQPLSGQYAKIINEPKKTVCEVPEDELAAFGVDDTMTVDEVFKKLEQILTKTNDAQE